MGSEGEFPAEWERDHNTFIESIPAPAKSLTGQAVPFVFAGNQFALSLPYRKGMTKYKAEQALQSAYELVANPSPVRKLLRGDLEWNLEKVIQDVKDAAYRNGVPADEVEKRARATIRGKYYHQYFRAFQENDQKGMLKAADALDRLGVGQRDIMENIQRREKLQPRL